MANKEICTIRIVFPVDDLEGAVEVKKKIDEVLKDTPDAQTQFSTMTNPMKPPIG